MPRLVVSSQFFLDRSHWEHLGRQILPALAARRLHVLRVWSAGCHAGKEAYALAILLAELTTPVTSHLLATDHDEALLARAAQGGPYSERDVEQLTAGQRSRFLEPGGPPHFVSRELRAAVDFQLRDLRAGPTPTGLDLILFRDVEPFFSDAVNRELYREFFRALTPGGVVFVGSTDSAPGWKEAGYRRPAPGFLQKPDKPSSQ